MCLQSRCQTWVTKSDVCLQCHERTKQFCKIFICSDPFQKYVCHRHRSMALVFDKFRRQFCRNYSAVYLKLINLTRNGDIR